MLTTASSAWRRGPPQVVAHAAVGTEVAEITGGQIAHPIAGSHAAKIAEVTNNYNNNNNYNNSTSHVRRCVHK